MKPIFLLLSVLILFSCKKEPKLNDGIHDDLVEMGVAKDSIQKMDVVLEKSDRKMLLFSTIIFIIIMNLTRKTMMKSRDQKENSSSIMLTKSIKNYSQN